MRNRHLFFLDIVLLVLTPTLSLVMRVDGTAWVASYAPDRKRGTTDQVSPAVLRRSATPMREGYALTRARQERTEARVITLLVR